MSGDNEEDLRQPSPLRIVQSITSDNAWGGHIHCFCRATCSNPPYLDNSCCICGYREIHKEAYDFDSELSCVQ